ncbi:hypothetical protein [Rhodospirillum centenum]|uniref:Yip1 domain-containing protein n=1 Tax=Rhodospirillum centenum (strain ATCC 51521 / SW) TaxID=414684 RepID=B6IPH9_RHOCS|nr:hypothetical protein [Rhodospirillum centenum]ACI99681.1 conserved hypothetical protein [Rhodospirillum centenum SW]
MSFARDALYGLYGAWRLARFDAAAAAWYDATPEAALASFRALWLVLPGFMLLLLFQLGGGFPPVMLAGRLVLESMGLVVGILAYLLVAFHVLELAGKQQEFGRYAAAYNWSYVVQVALLLGVHALDSSGLLGEEAAELMLFVATVWVLTYQWFIARATAGVGGLGALGLVAVDIFISIMVKNVTDAMVGLPAA